MVQFGVSQPVRRIEDARFTTGGGRYTDDINLPGQAYGYMLRSPFAHARIRAVDTAAAAAAPGVIAVITGADLDAEEANGIPCIVPITNRDGSEAVQPKRPVLCAGKVRCVGDNVAFVVAESLAEARDAAELIKVDYEPLAPVVHTAAAAEGDGPPVHDELPGNLAFDWGYGDEEAAAAAFARAAHVTRIELVNNRVVANAVEPRAAIAEHDPASGKTTLYTSTQGGWLLRDQLAADVLKVEPDRVRVVTPDVGGGFGMKIFFYPEQAIAAWAARKLARPVKWVGERSESFISDTMGRDNVTVAEMAFDAEHRILGLRVDTIANMGAYLSTFAPFIPTSAALKVTPGVYDVKALWMRVRGVFTNTVPVDAYRGAGRPEAIYVIERLMDQAARELGVDRIELRRRNFIPPAAMPFTTVAGESYDSGDFARVMDSALAAADWAGFAARRADAAARGRKRGIGLCYYIESTMGEPLEAAAVEFTDDGRVELLVGTQSTGQGHETAYAQVLAARTGIPFEAIRVVQGDTDRIPTGGGTGGSRSLTAEALAINTAGDAVIERGKQYAASWFEAAPGDIELDGGRFRIAGTDRSIAILDLAKEARKMDPPGEGLEGGLDARAETTLEAWTFPNGCHVAEVEVDAETGVTRLVRYTIVDDFGRLVNPLLVEGQVHGGVVQGIGQALLEQAVYDDDGQLLTGSFMDYCLPRADDLPAFSFATVEVPCRSNPMGVKGCGEAGSIASPAAVINALLDALGGDGVRALDMPATPETVWRAIAAARAGG